MKKQIFEQLENLYNNMDTQWNKIASIYGFTCNGCNENCCETEFYHHTLIEKVYLLNGLNQLPVPAVIAVKKQADKVCTKRGIAAKKGIPIRIMCPLNQDGRCILYKFRPMICRLHGLPHELRKPGHSAMFSPGCKAGSELFDKKGYIEFDRTPFYIQMAEIEKEYQRMMGASGRIRQSIAQMLIK